MFVTLLAACASDDATRKPTTSAQAPSTAPRGDAPVDDGTHLSDEERALLVRAFSEDAELSPDGERRLRVVLARIDGRIDGMPLDATASERARAVRASHRAILDVLVDEDVSVAARYAAAMLEAIPALPRTGPLTDDEMSMLARGRDDAFGPRSSDDIRQVVDALDVAVLAERAVDLERQRVGSPAKHPPTTREIAAAIARHAIARGKPLDGDLALRAQIGDACARVSLQGKWFLKAVYVGEEAHRGEFDVYSTDLQKIGVVGLPEAFTLDIVLREEKSAWDRGFVATLRGRDDGPAKGEVWTIDEQNDLVHVASGCAASFPIDDAIFGSLLTIDEERALADLVTRHALTDAEARPGGLALHKVLDAYRTVGRGTNDGHLDDRTLDEVASVLRRAVRVHHPSMRETDAEERIGGFLPLALDGKARRAGALRPLTEVEERDLVELSVREAVNEETLRLRHLALVGLISGDGLSRFSEASRSWLAGRVRARRPDQADAFERRARRQVCAQNAFEERMFLEEMAARQREHFERHGAFTDSIDELSVDGRLPTRLVFDFSQSTKERVVVEARYPEDSLLVGHHVRFEEGKRLQVLRDACAGLRSSTTDEE